MIDTRERIIRSAIDATVSTGWPSLTMADLADRVGVSRQTIYNEVGSKAALAEAMVLHELGAFLEVVEAAFDRHADDPVAAVRAATADVLAFARANALLRAILTADQGAATELLPLLTSRSTTVIDAASSVMAARLDPHLGGLDTDQREAAVDVIVRVVLSHVTQSSGDDRKVPEQIGWLAERLITDARVRQ